MDSLKTLMDKKSYDLVIKLTDNSHDPIALFYRVSAFLAVGQSENALNVILFNRLILQQKLAILIKFHIEILCLLRRFDEAYNELEYYKNLPYESQEVEEILRAMPAYIRKEEKASYGTAKPLDDDEIRKRLLSNSDEEVLAALDDIKNQPLDAFLLILLKIIKTHPRQVIRTFALLLLVERKYDKEIEFLYKDKVIRVVPSFLEDPFIIPDFLTIDKLSFALQSAYHDPSVAQNALHIISSYLLYIYPDKLYYSGEEIVVIFGYLAKKLLLIPIDDLKDICLTKGLDYDKISKAIAEIDEELKNF